MMHLCRVRPSGQPFLVLSPENPTSSGQAAVPPRPRLSSAQGDKDAPVRIIRGDNAAALTCLGDDPEVRGQVTFAYLDPPFWTGRPHRVLDRAPRGGDVAFDDRWPSLSDYLAHLRGRLEKVRDLLAPHGSLVVHVDPKTSHYIKVLLDELFGIDAFASEVVWRYRRWPSKTRNFQKVHDVMLRYVKDPTVEPRYNQLFEPLAASTLKTWGDKKQRAVVDESGKRLRSSTTPEASPGVPLGDVWEIGIVAPVSKERTGYPTQKPLALLRRWLEACTNPGDLVLDPYMGSGTTLLAAAELGRRAIGIDEGDASHAICRERLAAAGYGLQTQELIFSRPLATPRATKRALSATGS